MTTTNHPVDSTTRPDFPIPAGATADEWNSVCIVDGLLCRGLTWWRRDTAAGSVAVDGLQYQDGHIDRGISLYDVEGNNLTADDAFALASKLLEAARVLEELQ